MVSKLTFENSLFVDDLANLVQQFNLVFVFIDNFTLCNCGSNLVNVLVFELCHVQIPRDSRRVCTSVIMKLTCLGKIVNHFGQHGAARSSGSPNNLVTPRPKSMPSDDGARLPNQICLLQT